MKAIDSLYVTEKADRARRYALEAEKDRKNGFGDSAQRLLKLAAEQATALLEAIEAAGL